MLLPDLSKLSLRTDGPNVVHNIVEGLPTGTNRTQPRDPDPGLLVREERNARLQAAHWAEVEKQRRDEELAKERLGRRKELFEDKKSGETYKLYMEYLEKNGLKDEIKTPNPATLETVKRFRTQLNDWVKAMADFLKKEGQATQLKAEEEAEETPESQ